jgi:hypothetical protein
MGKLAAKFSRTPKKRDVNDVLREVLDRAHSIHPAYTLPGAVTSALEEAGYTIISHEEFDREMALTYQAGQLDAEA